MVVGSDVRVSERIVRLKRGSLAAFARLGVAGVISRLRMHERGVSVVVKLFG